MRLIDGDYIIEGLSHFNDRVNGDPHFINGIETAKEMIDNAPTVDAIPVEWLDEKILDLKHKDKALSAAAWLVLHAWQKEQEAR